jgi:hypothetical protein
MKKSIFIQVSDGLRVKKRDFFGMATQKIRLETMMDGLILKDQNNSLFL